MVTPQAALIYTMVLVSAADSDMSDAEMRTIGDVVGSLPVFRGYDKSLLPRTAEACAEMLDTEDGLENLLTLIKTSLPPKLRETAYAVACDVAISDETVPPETLRVLEMIRLRLEIDRLVGVAIERGASARFRTS